MSAQIVLSATTVTAGSVTSGYVLVQNATGHPLHASGCGSPFAVVLGNEEIKPRVSWLMCLERFTFPIGSSRWPVVVSASYPGCGRGKGIPACEEGGAPPPLPAGDYQATFFQGSHVVPRPASVDVHIVSR